MKTLIVIILCILGSTVFGQKQCYTQHYFINSDYYRPQRGCIERIMLDNIPAIMLVEDNDTIYFPVIETIVDDNMIVSTTQGKDEIVQFVYEEETELYFVLYNFNAKTEEYETVLVYL